jgi:hypothetical protein
MDRDNALGRRLLLERNAEHRKTPRTFAAPDKDSGHLSFRVPAVDYWHLVRVNPDLGATDPVIAGLAWRKFLNTEQGEKYKINPHEGKRGAPFKRGVIIR